MKAFIEIEYQRGGWNSRLSFVRAQEVNTPEGTAVSTELDAMLVRLSTLTLTPVAPVVELDPTLVNTVADLAPSVVEEVKKLVAEPAPEVIVHAPVIDATIEELTADPFAVAVPSAPQPVVAALSSKKNKTAGK